MTNYVSVRITKDSKNEFQLNHDFNESHNRKVNNKPNYLINDDVVTPFHRDTDTSLNTAPVESVINETIEHVKHVHKNDRVIEEGGQRRALKSNTQLKWSGIITFGNDTQTLTQSAMDRLDQELLNQNALNFFNEFIKENNLDKKSSYLVRHDDENMTHYHFKFIGYDLEKHEVFSNRVKKGFLSSLQDKVGRHFENSGFERGVKKYERILEALQKDNKSMDDYVNMSVNEKAVYKRNANVNNKSVNQLHNSLKNKVDNLENMLDKSISLIELVERSTTEEIKKIREDVEEDNNPIIKRFFTYAMRIHNTKANNEKAVKNLSNTIDKLDKKKKVLEDEFYKIQQQRYEQIIPVSFEEIGIQEGVNDVNKTSLLNQVVIAKKDFEAMQEYIKSLENVCKEYVEKHNETANLLKPIRQEVASFINLKDDIELMENKKFELKHDLRSFEVRLKELGNLTVALQKGDGGAKLAEQVESFSKSLKNDLKEAQKDINSLTK